MLLAKLIKVRYSASMWDVLFFWYKLRSLSVERHIPRQNYWKIFPELSDFCSIVIKKVVSHLLWNLTKSRSNSVCSFQCQVAKHGTQWEHNDATISWALNKLLHFLKDIQISTCFYTKTESKVWSGSFKWLKMALIFHQKCHVKVCHMQLKKNLTDTANPLYLLRSTEPNEIHTSLSIHTFIHWWELAMLLVLFIYLSIIYFCIASLVSVGRLLGHLLWLTGNCVQVN